MNQNERVNIAMAETGDALVERYREQGRDEVPITEFLRAMAAFFELIGDKARQRELEALASRPGGV